MGGIGLRTGWHLLALPPQVRRFQRRARRAARQHGDGWSLSAATMAGNLRSLLALARGRSSVVELGTATAWTTISLALADDRRRILSIDSDPRPDREIYLALAPAAARDRIRFVHGVAHEIPEGAPTPDLLYIDASHLRELTVREFEAWRPLLAPDALVVFDDYRNAAFPGVREAVEDLGLTGEEAGNFFVWRSPASADGHDPLASTSS